MERMFKVERHDLQLASDHGSTRSVDYVVVHELAHLAEMHHSNKFWLIVGSYYPEFERCKLTQLMQSICNSSHFILRHAAMNTMCTPR